MLEVTEVTIGGDGLNQMEQQAGGKQSKSEDGTPQVQIMAGAVLIAPAHPWQNVKSLADMSQGDQDKTADKRF